MIEIKKASAEELSRLMEVELLSFPPGEAAEPATFGYRLTQYPYWFRKAVVDGVLAGYICGRPVETMAGQGISDAMYEPEDYPEGNTFAFLAIGVDPAYRRQGVGEFLIRTIVFLCREKGLGRIILTCKEETVHYYARFGFEKMGLSRSQHGGAVWYDMELIL